MKKIKDLREIDKEIRRKLDYNPITGAFTWKVSGQGIKAGYPAGSVTHEGYWAIGIGKNYVPAHRLAYFIATGEQPETIVHEDRDRLNNSIENLRPVSDCEHRQRRGITKSNKSGTKGVSWDSRRGRWRGSIQANSRRCDKRFHTKVAAEAWVREMREQLHGEFCNHE